MKRFYSLMALLLLSSCAHQSQSPPTGLKPDAFWKDQKIRREQVNQISAKLRLTFYGKNRSISGRGQLVRQVQDKVRLELRDPFGRVHYLAVQDSKRFTAYYPRKRLAYVDSVGGNQYLQKFVGLDFPFDSLQDLFLGRIPTGKSEAIQNWKWDGNTGDYTGTLVRNGQTYELRVDGKGGHLNALAMPVKSGRVEVTYSHFEPCCRGVGRDSPVRVAGIVEIKLTSGLAGMEVEWERIRVLDKPRPSSVYRISLGEKDRTIRLR